LHTDLEKQIRGCPAITLRTIKGKARYGSARLTVSGTHDTITATVTGYAYEDEIKPDAEKEVAAGTRKVFLGCSRPTFSGCCCPERIHSGRKVSLGA